MKIRNGFVSNSSSSSFIIGVKNELTKKKIAKLFKVELEALTGSPLKPIISSFIQCIYDSAEKITVDEYIKEYYDGEVPNTVKKIMDNDMTLYHGSFSSEGEGAEYLLCDTDLNYESDEMIIEHNGGY